MNESTMKENKPMNITPEAREAAKRENLNAFDIEMGTEETKPMIPGHFAQLAINATVAEKDRRIQSLEAQLELVCNDRDREIERLKAENDASTEAYGEVCIKCAEHQNTSQQQARQIDTLAKQLAELREIAEGLAKCLQVWHECRMMTPSKDGDVLTRHTQWKEKNEK